MSDSLTWAQLIIAFLVLWASNSFSFYIGAKFGEWQAAKRNREQHLVAERNDLWVDVYGGEQLRS